MLSSKSVGFYSELNSYHVLILWSRICAKFEKSVRELFFQNNNNNNKLNTKICLSITYSTHRWKKLQPLFMLTVLCMSWIKSMPVYASDSMQPGQFINDFSDWDFQNICSFQVFKWNGKAHSLLMLFNLSFAVLPPPYFSNTLLKQDF